MATLQGFWSYVHADDEDDGGRITQLARDVARQFEMLTGEQIELFLDKDAIKWGEDWRGKIDTGLASVAFFIPVITPRYFMSTECRRELQFFARRATSLGIKDLVLPLYYVKVPALQAETTDDLVNLIRTFQWEEWRDLRFADLTTEAYRRGVYRLADRLVEANRLMEKSDSMAVVPQLDESPAEGEDDSPGLLDQMARAEESMPKLNQTIEAIGRDIMTVGQVMEEAARETKSGNTQAKGFAARLLIARKVAHRLSGPVDHILLSGNEFTSQLHDVDAGIRVIIHQAALEVRQNPEVKPAICKFFRTILNLSKSARESIAPTQGLIDVTGTLEKISRDLRPVLRRLRQGLTTMVEAREIYDDWVKLIDDSGVDCDDA
jgi:hypothetical protein